MLMESNVERRERRFLMGQMEWQIGLPVAKEIEKKKIWKELSSPKETSRRLLLASFSSQLIQAVLLNLLDSSFESRLKMLKG